MDERAKMQAQGNVHFTDCILRHMHRYRFLTHFDVYEVPILIQHEKFSDFLSHLMSWWVWYLTLYLGLDKRVT